MSMKPARTRLIIFISSLALLMVLIIQVNWIFQTAKIKEELFNEKANMVLSRTAEALSADTLACRKMETSIGKDENQKTDSLFTNYMKYYNFQIDYSFAVTQPGANATPKATGLKNNTYSKKLEEEASKNGLELNLFVPEKRQFIIAEMGPMFITSVVLIIVVLILFWRTILSLTREKQISDHTTEFLNNMTHEFKTPLTNIALAGRMITKDSGNIQEDKIKYYSGIILEENEKLRLQVEQVLSMTALERGEIPLQKTDLDFHQVIHDALRSMSLQIENRQGSVKLELEADNFVVKGDKTHLVNAMSNLIDNAIKYAKEKPDLFIQTHNSGHDLKIIVSDHGIGIEKEHQKKVFEKYFRVPTGDIHDVKGFGLGLAYVKTIIELHGGTIGLDSEKSKGTTITITIPYVRE